MTTESIELRQRNPSVASVSLQRTRSSELNLPPQDRGRDAWLLLLGSFVVEGFVWGYAFSFGVFQEAYSTIPQFAAQSSRIPIIGTTCTGIMYLVSPLALPLLRKYPHQRRHSMIAGTVLLALSFVAASFSATINHLIITQGVMVGIASAMTYYPVFSFLNDWFAQRIGFAYGVAWASSGLAGFILPYVFHWLLDKYSFRATFRIWAVVVLATVGTAITVFKSRTPHVTEVPVRRPRLTFAKDPIFIITCIGNLIQGVGFFLPGIYLPSYAIDAGFSSQIATTTVSILNIGTFVGFVCGGYIVDRFSSQLVSGMSAICGGVSVLLWGFSGHPALLIVFSVMYSFFGSCFVISWTGITREVVRKDSTETQTAETGIVYAFFIAGRGVGNVISGPMSQALLQAGRTNRSGLSGFGGAYGGIIIFTAVSAAFGGLGPFCALLSLR